MRTISIDCSRIPDALSLHRALAEALCFPEWYGNNLDALYDLLTSVKEDTSLTLQNFHALPSFALGFRMVLNDAEEENPCLYVYLA